MVFDGRYLYDTVFRVFVFSISRAFLPLVVDLNYDIVTLFTKLVNYKYIYIYT